MSDSCDQPVLAVPLTMISDYELLQEFTQGHESAFEALVHRHSRMVFSVCLRIVGDRASAEDVTQTVFIILARKAASLSSHTVIGGWLFITARTCALKMRQQRETRVKHERRIEKPVILSESNDILEMAPLLDQALADLPAVQRDVIVVHFLNQKSLADTARILGCPLETAHTRLNRGMARLRDRFRVRDSTSMALLLTRGGEDLPSPVVESMVKTAAGRCPAPSTVKALMHAFIHQSTLTAIGWTVAAVLIIGALAIVGLFVGRSRERVPAMATSVVVAAPQMLPDPLAGWRFVGLPAERVRITRNNEPALVMRIGQLAETEPFGTALRLLPEGDGGFVCECDYRFSSEYHYPRLLSFWPISADQADIPLSRTSFPDQAYEQNREDQRWYHQRIRCEKVSSNQGDWRITYMDNEVQSSVQYVWERPREFMVVVFAGIVDVADWKVTPLEISIKAPLNQY